MSLIGGKTKKVTTYGKKKTQIIAIHSDFTPVKRTKSPRAVDNDTSPDRLATPVRTTSRPPLATKLSQDVVASRFNVPAAMPVPVKGLKGVAQPVTHLDRVTEKPKSAASAVSRVPKASMSRAHRHTPIKARARLECVEIVSKRPTGRPPVDVNDLADDLEDLVIAEAPQRPIATPSSSALPSPSQGSSSTSALDNLLQACTCTTILPFDTFLSSPTFLDLIPARTQAGVTKIGEASYSEVYSVKRGKKEMVIKVVPLISDADSGADTKDMPDCSSLADVLREVEITRTMSGLPEGGFIDYQGAFVVQGVYPEELLHEWDAYKEREGSDSIRPDAFTSDQTYAVIVLEDGGADLESFKFDKSVGWQQASGVFWQITDALARAEQACSFEHRDLHEGQILITPCPISSSSADPLDPTSSGVTATIIDFGLSRLVSDDERVIWSDMPSEVFDGQGDQWDVYRAIREEVQGDWKAYHPITNVLWLRYILRYLLHSKDLRKPRPIKLTNSSAPPSPIRTRRVPLARHREVSTDDVVRSVTIHDSLKAVEKALGDAFAGKRGTSGLESAREVMELGKAMGFVA